MGALLTAQDLSFAYDDWPVLDGVSLPSRVANLSA